MTDGSDGYLVDLWFLMAGRIAPPFCCRSPMPLYGIFLSAVREVAHQNGDLDQAVRYLHEIVTNAPPEWMVFQQAGQLLNIIEWRKTYHPGWFSPTMKVQRLKPEKFDSHIAHAMALLQTGADDEGLDLTSMIIEKSDAWSDDRRLAHLIRAAILICTGDPDAGEEELQRAERSGFRPSAP